MLRTVAIHAQGLRHDAGALIAALAVGAAVAGHLIGGTGATFVALALFAAGILHGAADEGRHDIVAFSVVHAGGYVAFAAAIAALYLASPLLGLAAFLAISGWHFAISPADFDRASRYAIAGCAIGGSALFHPAPTAEVFAAITGLAIPGAAMQPLAIVGAGGVALAGLAAARRANGMWQAILAVLAVILLEPVLAVALIFFVAHALPVQREQIADHGLDRVLKAIAPTGIPALAGAIALIALAWLGYVALPLAAAIAIGVATPHMLTERL